METAAAPNKLSLRKRYQKYKDTHRPFRFFAEFGGGFLICCLSAFLLVFGSRAFITPDQNIAGADLPRIVAGGVTGISQVITKISQMIIGFDESAPLLGGSITTFELIRQIVYFTLNIPLIIISFLKIGKRFSIFSMLNVIITTVLGIFIPASFFNAFAGFFSGMILSRAIIGGVIVGLSSAVAFRFGQSAAGIDIVGHILASRKSTMTGKYVLTLNAIIMLAFVVLSLISPDAGQKAYLTRLNGGDENYGFLLLFALMGITAFCSIAYLFTSSTLIDRINLRNKKTLIQVITSDVNLSDVLLKTFKHGVTTIKGRGEYTKEEKIIIYIVISYYETNEVITVIKEHDEHAFINIMDIKQVYGRFYIPPVK